MGRISRMLWSVALFMMVLMCIESITFGAAARKYSEAPMLARLVKQGKLPSVDKRLPEEPMVVRPIEEIGQYGGTWRRALTGVTDREGYQVLVRESLVIWDYRDGKLRVVPDLAKSWEILDGGRVYVFHLRKGVKWSDGQPFTADDILFWYKDVLLNEEITPAFPTWLVVGDEKGKVEKVDDYTIKFSFKVPYGIFLETLAFSGRDMLTPKHYLKNFHPAYTSMQKLNEKAKAEKLDTWYQLFQNKNDLFLNPDRPVLSAWKVSIPFPATRMAAERNPYYWKVDTSGNQLPYIDRIECDLVQQTDMINMRALSGDIDMQYRSISFTNYTLLMENRQKGGYRVLRWRGGTTPCLYINQNVKDQVLRKLFEDLRFRTAISIAINREEINNLFFSGLGEIRQPVAAPGDPFYKEEFGKNAIEYNPSKANKLLDEMGLTKRDKSGFRLRPDGKVLSLTIETFPFEMGVSATDVYETVKGHLEKIGIKVAVKEEDRSLWVVRVTGGEAEIPGYGRATLNWVLDPLWYVPTSSATYWAPLYGLWYASGGKGGEEPKGDIRRLQELYDRLKVTPNEEERLKLGQQILEINDRNLYVIGTVGIPFQPVVVKDNFRNVLESGVADYRTLHESITWPEQCFIKQK